jgi:hypothetical protein
MTIPPLAMNSRRIRIGQLLIRPIISAPTIAARRPDAAE